MFRQVAAAALCAIVICAGAGAGAAPAADDAALARTGELGRDIYRYDHAAWVSTDAMVEAFGNDLESLGLTGYVVEPVGEGLLRATYYGGEGDALRAIFVAEVRDRQVVSSRAVKPGEDGTLSPVARHMAAAQQAAATEAQKHRYAPCANHPFNLVMLPPATADGPVLVYFLTPQLEVNAYPFGGHYLVEVGADGKVVSSRAFTKSCLTLPSAAPDGGQLAGLMVSHVMDPTPTEIHVFLSLSAQLPVHVATGDGAVWKVAGERIGRSKD
jgi:hypothetical protein